MMQTEYDQTDRTGNEVTIKAKAQEDSMMEKGEYYGVKNQVTPWNVEIVDEERSKTSEDPSTIVEGPPPLQRVERVSTPGAFRISPSTPTPIVSLSDGILRDDEESTFISYPSIPASLFDKPERFVEAELVAETSFPIQESSQIYAEAEPWRQHELLFCCIKSWTSLCCLAIVLVFMTLLGLLIGGVLGSRYIPSENTHTESPVVSRFSDIPSKSPIRTEFISLPPSVTKMTVTSVPTMSSQPRLSTLPSLRATDAHTLSPTDTHSSAPTPQPSLKPTNLDFVDDILAAETRMSLLIPNSPQSMAYDWLFGDPSIEEYSLQRKLQRFVLATVYYSTNGEEWSKQDNWMSYNHHECEWYSDLPMGIVCSDDMYQILSLSDNDVNGVIPDELWHLTSLVAVGFYKQSLMGTISKSIGRMANLEHLALHDLSKSGSIPSELGSISQLAFLDLGMNDLLSTIPTELANISILRYLSLNDNSLTSTIPTELGALDRLEDLILLSNLLEGKIPTELGKIKDLKNLYLGYNNLAGPLPTELSRLKRLSVLSAQSNSLTGSIPTEYASLTKLKTVLLGNNELTDKIPASVISKWDQVEYLDLGSNNFNGPIPTELSMLTNAAIIDLFNNSLTGTIPTELDLLDNAQIVLFEQNQLQGTIPSALALLPQLQRIWLHDNNLTGFVPPDLCDLVEAGFLDLSVDCNKVVCDCSCDCSQSTTVEPETKLSANATQISSDEAGWEKFVSYISGIFN